MKTISFGKVISLAIAGFIIVAVVLLIVPQPASANPSVITNYSNSGGWGVSNGIKEDNRPYSIAGIRACVTTHVGDAAASASTTITTAKGNALVACIKQARLKSDRSSAVEALLKKIDELRKEIEALRNR